MFALFVATKGGCVVFYCSKANFRVAPELESFLFPGSSPDSQICEGQGNRRVAEG